MKIRLLISTVTLTAISTTIFASSATSVPRASAAPSPWGIRAGMVLSIRSTNKLPSAQLVYNNGQFEGALGAFGKFHSDADGGQNWGLLGHVAKVYHFSNPRYTWLVGLSASYESLPAYTDELNPKNNQAVGNNTTAELFLAIHDQFSEKMNLGISTDLLQWGKFRRNHDSTYYLLSSSHIDITYMF